MGLVRVEFSVAGRRVVVSDDMSFREFAELWQELREAVGRPCMVDRLFVAIVRVVLYVHGLNEALGEAVGGGENEDSRGDDSGL